MTHTSIFSPLHKSSLAVCLRGFNPREQERAASLLTARGHRVVRSINAAQFVVAGPDADNSVLETSRARGLQIAPWQAVREELAEAPDAIDGMEHGTVPLSRETVHPLFQQVDGSIHILGHVLPRNAAPAEAADLRHVPGAARFAGLCFDQPFVETLHAVLTGTCHAMPVALEGETAASKTTAVLYLAHLLDQPVVRLNLNGQTDAGELVGRFTPSASGWEFQEGALPTAMRRGHWLLLDEMNLAEPQVLERLNSALESPPTLVVSEGHGTVFGPRGDVEVADGFRLLATLNPAEYSGRSVLSPAFRNRWLIWHQAATPCEADVLAMLRTLVFGEQPVVHWQGRALQAPSGAPLFPSLGGIEGIDALLRNFALFHSTVARAAAPPAGTSPGLARHRRERDTFTRRNLTATLQLFQAGVAADSGKPAASLAAAIQQIYAGRYPDPADRKAIHSHARAAGLA